MDNSLLHTLERRLRGLLETLPARERDELHAAAESPLFGATPAVRRLLQYVLERHDKRPEPGFHLQVLYLEAFQRKIIDAGKLREALAGAIALTEDYLAWKALRADRVQRTEYLTRHLAASPDPALFRDALDRWQEALDTAPESLDRLYRQGRLLQAEWSHWATDRYKRAPRLIGRLAETYETYDHTTRLLLDLVGAMRAQLITDAPADAQALPPAPARTLVAVCAQAAALNARPADAEGYTAFWHAYTTTLLQLGEAEREALLRFAINYCNRQIQAGHPVFIHHLAALCRWAVEQPVFSARWVRSDEDFINMALAFCRREGLAEMKAFIDTHLPRLPAETRAEAGALTRAFYFFFKDDFRAALAELEHVTSREFPYKLRYHSLRIRAWYALGEYNALESALEAYDKYFDRDEWLHDGRRASYVRLAWFVRRLAHLDDPRHDRAARAKARTELVRALHDPAAVKPVAWEWVAAQLARE